MKTLIVPISDAAEETWRKEAERQGKTVEQVVCAAIEEDARRRARQWLADELEVGFRAAEEGRVVTIETDRLVEHIAEKHHGSGKD